MIISGNASEEESAAVAAVIAQVLAEEAGATSAPPARPTQSDWIKSWRPRNTNAVSRKPTDAKGPKGEAEPKN